MNEIMTLDQSMSSPATSNPPTIKSVISTAQSTISTIKL